MSPEGDKAVIYRDVNEPGFALVMEVLASNGRWRQKTENDALFDDEKHDVIHP